MNEDTKTLTAEALKKSKKKRIFRDNMTLFSMSLPALVCVIIFGYLPMVGILIAFKDYVP